MQKILIENHKNVIQKIKPYNSTKIIINNEYRICDYVSYTKR